MSSIVDICNEALSRVQAPRITALDDDTESAIECDRAYDAARRHVLAAGDWVFATKVVALGRLSDAELGWEYAYEMPTDVMKVLGPYDPHTRRVKNVRFEARGSHLLADEDDVSLKYIYDIVDSTKFPPLFVEALAFRLGYAIAMPLTESWATQNNMARGYQTALSEARADNSNIGEDCYSPFTRYADVRQ